MSIKYLGHSCFEIKTGEQTILIDPFLIASPNYEPKNLTDIFVTHGHSDHLGCAIELSKKTGAKITGIYELASYCGRKGAITNGIGLGSWINYNWGRVVAVPAFYSSSLPDGTYGGNPCGYVFEINNKRIYHAGDTSLNSEMKMIGEIYKPEISLLPIGGHYTMDIEHAAIAASWLNSSIIIPMHYNTFDAISVDIKEFEAKIKELNKIPIAMKMGQIYE